MEQQKTNANRYFVNLWLGIFLIIAGVFVAVDKMYFGVSTWVLYWPICLIICGLVVGVHNKFKNIFWLIITFWGAFLLMEVQFPSLNLGQYATPLSLILTGLIIVVIKRYRKNLPQGRTEYSNEGFTSITAVFDYPKRSITTENFTGCDVTCVMGGTVVDLSNAQVKQSALLDVTAVFGSAKIIIPSNWQLVNDITAIFGAVEDKRAPTNSNAIDTKTVRLDGTVLFGGVEIVSC